MAHIDQPHCASCVNDENSDFNVFIDGYCCVHGSQKDCDAHDENVEKFYTLVDQL